MSRVNNQPPQQPVQNQQRPPADNKATTQKAGENSFANRLNQKNDQPKSKTTTQPQQLADAKSSSTSSTLLGRQGQAVVSRRGGGNTVADLQAKLEGFQGGKGTHSLEGHASLDGKDSKLGKLDGQSDQLQTDNLLDKGQHADLGGLAGQQQLMGGPDGLTQSATVQIQGGKIPTAMLDKMVDHARVGVNGAGAPEFQFDLKGDVLGGLKMRMSMENGQLKAIFVAENPEVRRLIDGNMQDLRKALEDRGIHIKDLEVRDPKEDQRQRQRDQHNKDRKDAFGGNSE